MTQYLGECRLRDELGINIMVNGHHAAYTCMNVSCTLTLGTPAAAAKNARRLALGVPLLNRMGPLRVAEEIASVDLLSRGRLEVGLIKGSTFEPCVSNAAAKAHAGDSGRKVCEEALQLHGAIGSTDEIMPGIT
ncbi:MAG: LLM class flavin-dependent oxidoreductase [Betaproteobacteria bacterium]|nr:LLM class flavin-dependent oxidoreductase [Betaproteobacteria bacterium]